MSVGESEVNINAINNKVRFSFFISCEKNQVATPVTAIINVGDSALWLKITTHIKTDERVNNLK
jgi:uncharacterized protein YcsI (UPF0317 family)